MAFQWDKCICFPNVCVCVCLLKDMVSGARVDQCGLFTATKNICRFTVSSALQWNCMQHWCSYEKYVNFTFFFFFFPWMRSREQLSAAQWTGESNCWATYLNTVTKTLQVLAGVSVKKNIKIITGGFTELASWKDGNMTHLFHIYSGQNALFCEKANLCLLSIFVFHHLWLDIF